MHLLEKYSLNCGVNPAKLGKPYIYSSYYPLPFQKYIVVHASSGMPSKNYSRYQDVFDFCSKDLADAGYALVQIGGKEDQKINGCLHLQGKTNIHQSAFILKNASLLVANDSFSTHICSAFNVPSVTLYSVSPPEVCGPFWKSERNISIFSQPEKDKKPCYSNIDPARTIDKIKPEQVIDAIFSLLNLNLKRNLNTIYAGDSYGKHEINLVPDSPFFVDISPESIINIRFDLIKENISNKHLESALINLQRRKCAILTKKPLPLEIFADNLVKRNTEAVFIEISKNNLKDLDDLLPFCKGLKKIGITAVARILESELSEEESSYVKLHFIDTIYAWGKKNTAIDKIKELKIEEKIKPLTFVKSSSIYFSQGKLFLSEETVKKNKPCQPNLMQRLSDIGGINSLREDLDSLYIFNIEEKNASKK